MASCCDSSIAEEKVLLLQNIYYSAGNKRENCLEEAGSRWRIRPPDLSAQDESLTTVTEQAAMRGTLAGNLVAVPFLI